MRSYYPGYGEKSGRTAIFVLFLIGVVLTVGLYFVKTHALTAKAEAAHLQRMVSSQQSAVKVLEAELAHLESPNRLADMARKELGLTPIKVEQVLSVDEIVETFPLRDEPLGETGGGAHE